MTAGIKNNKTRIFNIKIQSSMQIDNITNIDKNYN